MQRLHVSLNVDDLSRSISFYSTLLAAEPTMLKEDYAQWMLDDPRVNLSLVVSDSKTGLNHLGIQAETDAELSNLYGRLQQTEENILNEGDTICCYAKSNKRWVTDPVNISWEAFKTDERTENFSSDEPKAETAARCDSNCSC